MGFKTLYQRRQRIHSQRLNAKISLVLLLLGSLCAAILPIPLSYIDLETIDFSNPFPCMSCGCGCKTAQQCWTDCCCYTPVQRAQWAEANGVAPPIYAVLGEPSSQPESDSQPKDSSQSLPAKKVTCPKCVVHEALREKVRGTPNESSKGEAQGAKEDEAKHRLLSSRKSKWVLSMMAYRCQGGSSVFQSMAYALPSVFWTSNLELVELGDSHRMVPPRAEPVFLELDLPPPRSAAESC